MASPRVATDLQQPNGLLTAALFPNLSAADLESMLQGFLNAGYEQADAIDAPQTQARKDSAAMAWAYYMGYRVIWQRLSSMPAQTSLDGQASQQYLESQIATFKTLSDEQLMAFQFFFSAGDTATSPIARVAPDVPTAFTW